MKIKSVEMNLSATSPKHYPDDDFLQVAFVGRSNVGKSSAINTLLNRKSIARVSQSPGKTRTINFYTVNEQFYFVDLPGYGYAKLSKEEQEGWGKMMERYFIESPNLIHLFLLVDIRHEPKDSDVQMYQFAHHWNIPITVIATKSDKINRSQLQKNISIIRKKLKLLNGEEVFMISSLKKTGKEEIWNKMIEIFAENGVQIDEE
jgi:ribosome biogenesis GTP-binding protein ysxC